MFYIYGMYLEEDAVKRNNSSTKRSGKDAASESVSVKNQPSLKVFYCKFIYIQ